VRALIIETSTVYHPHDTNEAHLETHLRSIAPVLFPDYDWCVFRALVESEDGSARPDAALVAKDYSEWWVVEVEKIEHSTIYHVEPQLRKLSGGIYAARHRATLLNENSRLEAAGVARLPIAQPRFLLIVDHATPVIHTIAAQHSFEVLQATPFKSQSNHYAMACSGVVPKLVSPRARALAFVSTVPDTRQSPYVTILRYDSEARVEYEGAFEITVAGLPTGARNDTPGQHLILRLPPHTFSQLFGGVVRFAVHDREGVLTLRPLGGNA
jgi:hypothetical protein